MRKNNLEDKIKFWLSGREDIRKAPPEVLAFLYSAYKKPHKKKKTEAPLQGPQKKQGSNEETSSSNSRGRRKGIDPFNQL